MPRFFFLLSGEHDKLPASELEAILEAECCKYKVLEKLDQVVRLECDSRFLEPLKQRAALTRLCALELFACEAETSTIVKLLRSANLTQALASKKCFAVRIKRVRRYASNIDLMTLERTIGELVQDLVSNVKVDLKKPEATIFGILTDQRFVLGTKLFDIPAKPFVERRPKKRPFFHPSAMQPKLARCMVNLARPRAGDFVLDPFCGTGTMLAEASLIKCRVLGFDIQRRMARGTLENLKHLKTEPEGIVVSDSRNMPVRTFDCVVTDPPYGISSSTRRRTTRQLVEELLTEVHGILDKGRFICIASPKTLGIGEIGEPLGFRHLESYFVYVHRSLTREIAVFEKKV